MVGPSTLRIFMKLNCPGRNKLIINHLGKLFVTSDAATIIREIEVAHPAAKLLVMASTAQEGEVSMEVPLG
jgi:chaperonin GroEL (HSP60 family)